MEKKTIMKIKTFSIPLKIFHVKDELEELDSMVNRFIEENSVKRIISVNDACTTDDTGATIGIIRVLAYDLG